MIGVITINTYIMIDNSEHFNNITFFLYYTSFGRRITSSNIYRDEGMEMFREQLLHTNKHGNRPMKIKTER